MNLKVEKLEGAEGAEVALSDVLLVAGEGAPRIGTPIVAGASVTAKIVSHDKDKKILVYKKKRRKGYEKRYGHRQPYTEINITKISS